MCLPGDASTGEGRTMIRRKKKGLRIWPEDGWTGVSQLSLVEHALCPLDPPEGPFEHVGEYFYYVDGKKQLGKGVVA